MHRSKLSVTAGKNSSTKLQIMGFDMGSSPLGLLLADSKFSQLGELAVLATNLFRVDLNSWGAVELENRVATMRRDKNNNSPKNKSQHHVTIPSYTNSMTGSQTVGQWLAIASGEGAATQSRLSLTFSCPTASIEATEHASLRITSLC